MTNEELCERIRSGERDLIITLWEQIRSLVVKIMIKDYLPRDGSTNKVELDDLIQAGFLGMLSAIEDFDPSSGFTFTTFLNYHLKNAARDALGRRSHKQDRDPIHRAISVELPVSTDTEEISIMDSLRDESMTYVYDDIIDRITEQQEIHTILQQRERLRPDEREVFDEIYLNGLTLVAVAEKHGYTRNRAKSLHEQALRKIRRSPVIMKMKRYDPDKQTNFYAHKGLDAFNTSFNSVVEDSVMFREWCRQQFSERVYKSIFGED
jgi:RNA polymerase sigma factor (sigma-70 family)